MIGCVGAAFILFAGLFFAWILFDPLSYMINLFQAQTNGHGFMYLSFVNLVIISFPLFLLVMAFVTAYNYMKKRRRA